MKCEHCGSSLPQFTGTRGEESYLKHGCWGEVKKYLDGMSREFQQSVANRLMDGKYSPNEPYSLIGRVQPVDWAKCSSEIWKYFRIKK